MKIGLIFIITTLTAIATGFSFREGFSNTEGTPEYGAFTDPRDKHTYKTVKIGEQVWLAENFAYLPNVCPPVSSGCGLWVYGFEGTDIAKAKTTQEYQKYGVLYSWEMAVQLAPEGWHLPTDEEWQELESYLGIAEAGGEEKVWRGAGTEADRLKKGGDTGLNVIFGGWITDYGKFNFIEEHANFWCSTEYDAKRGYERLIGKRNGKIGRDSGNKGCGFSVRYIRD